MSKIYLIGSLRHDRVPKVAEELRKYGHDVFDDWHAAGPEADDQWQRYEQDRGRTYAEALHGDAATHVFEFDLNHLNWCEIGALVLPAGKSGHLELGFLVGMHKRTFILLEEDDPERWDVMYRFADRVSANVEDLVELAAEDMRMRRQFREQRKELGI